jgi:hypothetical protein
VEGSGHGLIKVLPCNSSGATEEKHETYMRRVSFRAKILTRDLPNADGMLTTRPQLSVTSSGCSGFSTILIPWRCE